MTDNPQRPTPDPRPADKEEIGTDLSEIARARLSDTDKSQASSSIGPDAADAAAGVAGTPADDDTAAAVEESPTAVLGKNHPGPKARGERDVDAPDVTPAPGGVGTPPPMTATGGGSQTAPLPTNPAGTGAPTVPPSPASAATPTSAAQGAPSGPSASGAPAATPPSAGGSDRPAPTPGISTGGAATPPKAAESVPTPTQPAGPGITPTDAPATASGHDVPQANEPGKSDKEASTGAGAVVPGAGPTTGPGTAPATPPAVTPAQGQTPAQAGLPKSADPDTTATSPTAPDAAPTSGAAASAASGQAVTDVKEPPGSPTRPAGARPAGAGAAPAGGGRPNTARPDGAAAPERPAAGAKPTGAARPSPAARPAGAAPGAAAERPAAGAKPTGGARPAAAAKPAAPAKPPEPDPDEVTALRELVPDLTWERRHGYVEVKVPSAKLVSVAQKVKALGYDYLSAVTAVDWRDRLEMLYHCYGWDYIQTPGCVVIRADLPPEPNPLCPSLTAVWPGADFQEREVYDLFGIKFVGHPDLRRILLEDRFPGHPLRKDWTFDYEYVLVRHLRYGAEGQEGPATGEEGFRRV